MEKIKGRGCVKAPPWWCAFFPYLDSKTTLKMTPGHHVTPTAAQHDLRQLGEQATNIHETLRQTQMDAWLCVHETQVGNAVSRAQECQ